MKEIKIEIEDYGLTRTEYAAIRIYNCRLTDIWQYIKRLKINKNKIEDFWVTLYEDGFVYNINYTTIHYRRFVDNIVKKFRKLNKVYPLICGVLIIDMKSGKKYRIKAKGRFRWIHFPLSSYPGDLSGGLKRKLEGHLQKHKEIFDKEKEEK